MDTVFIENLTRQLHEYEDETLSVDTILEIITTAANEAVDNPANLRLYREIDPSELSPLIILQVDVESILLQPEHITTLRALLLNFDENAPPRIGEPLALPCKLRNGRVVSVVTEELLG